MRDWFTIVVTSSRVKVDAASSLGSTPNRRTAWLAIQFSATITGWNRRETQTSGVASMSTARSGTENARFFGTISPNTTCRYETSSSATRNAITSTIASARPVSPSGSASRWWIAGSETFRISSEQMVMPSWLVASMSVACSIAYSAVFAAREPFSASGSICERRAEMTANSAPTKNALKASSTTSHAIPAQSLTSAHPLRPGPAPRRGDACA